MKDFCNIAVLQQIIHAVGKDGIYVSLEHHPAVLPSDPLKGISCFDSETSFGVGQVPAPEMPIFPIKSFADDVEDLWAIKALPRERKHWEHLRKSRW